MVKIYKKYRLAIIEGVGQFIPSTLSFTIDNGVVNIYSQGKKKSVFNALWDVINNESGNTFLSENDLQVYLSETFTDDYSDEDIENRITIIEEQTDGLIEGVDFLTLYRLKRDN